MLEGRRSWAGMAVVAAVATVGQIGKTGQQAGTKQKLFPCTGLQWQVLPTLRVGLSHLISLIKESPIGISRGFSFS